MTDSMTPVEVREAIALALLNSDREAAGFPPVESRANVPDSDGYLRNADAVLPFIHEAALAENRECAAVALNADPPPGMGQHPKDGG